MFEGASAWNGCSIIASRQSNNAHHRSRPANYVRATESRFNEENRGYSPGFLLVLRDQFDFMMPLASKSLCGLYPESCRFFTYVS